MEQTIPESYYCTIDAGTRAHYNPLHLSASQPPTKKASSFVRHPRFRPAIALIALIILSSFLTTQRSTVARAQSTNGTSTAQATTGPIELVGSFGGTVEVLSVEGSLAYVGEGGGLRIVDISDPAQPSKRGYLPLPDFPQSADVVGNTAYIAAATGGLQIVDVSSADSPRLLGSYAINGTMIHVQVVDDLAYIGEGGGLRIVDISDPSQPTLRGSYRLEGSPTDFEVVGTLAYITLGWNGFQIIDVIDPANPTERGFYWALNYAKNVAVSGNRAYVNDQRGWNWDGGLTILDVSDPELPTLLGTYGGALSILDLQVVGNLAYLANGFGYELQIVDVSDPANLVVRGSYIPSFGLEEVIIAAGRAYLTVSNGMEIVDVGNPDSLVLRGTYDTLRHVYGVYSAGSFVYLIGSGLHILDVSDPAQPRLRGVYPAQVRDVQVVGNLAYVLTNNELQIVNVANPDAPTLMSSRSSNIYPGDILVRGNRAYVSGDAGLTIFDISNPSQPTSLGSYTRRFSGGNGFDMAGDLAYLTASVCSLTCYGGLEIVDVSNPSNPTLRGVYEQAMYNVDVLGDRAYLTYGTVEILDVSEPDQPKLSTVYQSPTQAIRLQFQDGYAYIADGNMGGLHIAAVTNLGRLQPRATYKTASYATDLHVVGDMVYLVNADNGLKIFRVHPEQFPSNIFVPLIAAP